MINVKKAYNIFKLKYSYVIEDIIDYDSDWYIFAVIKDKNNIDFNDPYYALNKSTGEIVNFSPADDMLKFVKALRTKKINPKIYKG